jgi:hypothetical protein
MRVEVHPPVRVQLSGIALDRVTAAHGEFVEWAPGALILSATWLKAGRADYKVNGETVVLPLANLGKLERKTVSLPRSLGLAGIAVLGSAALHGALGGGGGGGIGGPPPIQR